MIFHAYGPFDLPANLTATSAPMKAFWSEVQDWSARYTPDGIDRAIGCYLYVTVRGDLIVPRYVGKTEAKTGFKGEITQSHKLQKYAERVPKGHSRKIFFFPLVSHHNTRFAKPSEKSREVISWLEAMLIGQAYATNPDILNKRDTKLLRNCYVEGVFGKQVTGRPSEAATLAKRALLAR